MAPRGTFCRAEGGEFVGKNSFLLFFSGCPRDNPEKLVESNFLDRIHPLLQDEISIIRSVCTSIGTRFEGPKTKAFMGKHITGTKQSKNGGNCRTSGNCATAGRANLMKITL